MRRVHVLLCAAGALVLLSIGPDQSPGQVKVEVKKAMAPAQVPDAVLQQWEQQFLPQFRQMHRMEMHFLRVVCEPTRKQYEAIAAEGEAGMKDALRKYAAAMRGLGGDSSDPRTLIAEGILKSAQTHLPPERVERYRKELELRTEARKRMTVANLVAMIDRHVLLSADQRAKLAEVLATNWNDSWNQTQILIYGGQYFPAMPDAKILPVLTETQRAVWRGVTKANIRFGVNLGIVQGVQIEDEVWDDDPPRKDDKAAPKTAPVPKAGGKR
jgi:hypothetical protein